MRLPAFVAATIVSIGTCAAQNAGTPVDVELLLAVDVSGSMDAEEHAVQREGYLQAIVHPEFIGAVTAGFHGRIALSYMEWAGPRSQVIVVPWREIDSAEGAESFAAALAARPIAPIRGTSIAGAIGYGTSLFAGSGYDGVRRIIDISGDGPNRGGGTATTARDAAVAAGFIINGLPIMIRPSSSAVSLDRYYWDCVTGGPGSFVIPVAEPGELAAAIRRKLILEVAGITPARVQPVQAIQPVDCLAVENAGPGWTP